MTIGLLKQALHALRHETRSRSAFSLRATLPTPSRDRKLFRWFKWLAPGLLVKR